MMTFDQAMQSASPRPAFSNGTEGEAWQEGWCGRCRNDDMDRGGEKSCPLLEVAILGATPSQWGKRKSALGPGMYECTEYEAIG